MRHGLGSLIAACVAAFAACSFDTSGLGGRGDGGQVVEGDGGQRGDARPPGDADPDRDAHPPRACEADEVELPFEAANLGRCVPRPEDALEVPTGVRWRLDTDSIVLESLDAVGRSPPSIAAYAEVAQADGPDILIVVFESIRVREAAYLEARGSRALAPVSLSSFQLEADAIVSAAASGVESGAGAHEASCAASGGRGQGGERQDFDGDEGGSGGGGGGFGEGGGHGAAVQANDERAGPSAGGAAGGDETGRSPLFAGCRGGRGHQVDDGSGVPEDAGAGGGAGGALQLVAAGAIDVRGIVTVSGGGGQPGVAHSGGGGGGSGGSILIEAAAVELRGALTANGGGGGEGMRRVTTGACATPTPGRDGAIDTSDPAAGGASSDCSTSGRGGDGGALGVGRGGDGEEGASTSSSGSGPAPAGGGGGGGAVGRIRIDTCEGATAFGPVLSPAPVVADELVCE
jgi:hypothetical protein